MDDRSGADPPPATPAAHFRMCTRLETFQLGRKLLVRAECFHPLLLLILFSFAVKVVRKYELNSQQVSVTG